MKRECRSVEEFERINKISEGTYGVVYKVSKQAGRTHTLLQLQCASSAHVANAMV
jgi:hypothetical protein